jgi:hypothetical protein
MQSAPKIERTLNGYSYIAFVFQTVVNSFYWSIIMLYQAECSTNSNICGLPEGRRGLIHLFGLFGVVGTDVLIVAEPAHTNIGNHLERKQIQNYSTISAKITSQHASSSSFSGFIFRIHHMNIIASTSPTGLRNDTTIRQHATRLGRIPPGASPPQLIPQTSWPLQPNARDASPGREASVERDARRVRDLPSKSTHSLIQCTGWCSRRH